MTLVLQPITSKMKSLYANETLTLRTEWRSLVASAPSNLSRNSLKENVLFYIKFYFEIKCGKSKGIQEKVSTMSVWCG